MAKMTDINLSEISLVDHPAHMLEGFAIIKSADPETDRAVSRALRKETMPDEKTLAEVLKDASVDELRAALSDEQLAELAPEPVAKAAEVEPTEEDVLKSVPAEVRAMIEKRDAEIAEFQKAARESAEAAEIAKAAALDGEAIAKSKEDYTNLAFAHDKVAPALRKFAAENADAAEEITTMLKAVNAQADGALFDELGTAREVSKEAEPDSKLEALAKAKAAADGVPFHKAFAEVVADPANKTLVTEHFEEN